MGTSKGGTAALYFGIKCHATDIVIGACQYRIGSYVSNYPDIFKGMTGHEPNDEDIKQMDSIMPHALDEMEANSANIALVHSAKEPTYQRDIKYLIQDLNEKQINWKEFECGFENHDEVGKHFIPVAAKILEELNQNSL